MKLIVGLGNIGQEYRGTRHNAGFAVLDTFATENNLTWQRKDKFKADIAEGQVSGEKVVLVKPTTLYNLSGEAVQAVAHFYKIPPADTLIVHDELALPFGTVRTRLSGSDAGNNGIKSVIAALGPDVARVRIGIANEFAARQDAADFVLGRFSTTEQKAFPAIQKNASKQITAFLAGDFAHTTISS